MTDWTILTLKEHLERRLCDFEKLRKQDLASFKAYADARADALKLQAQEYERRLDGLNGEQGRIAANQAASVGREIWDRFQEADRDWKNKADIAIANCVTKETFKTTEQALQLAAGKSSGVDKSTAAMVVIMTTIAAVVAAGAAVLAVYHH